MSLTRALVLLVLGFTFCGVPGSAHAKVTFCNQTAVPVDVAFAWGQKDAPGTSTGGHLGVMVKGWWNVPPHGCKQVSGIKAHEYFLYYHAKGEGKNWSGNSKLCVQSKAFEMPQQFQRGSCSGGQYAAGFRSSTSSTPNFTINMN